jgi:hypothetical protein
MSGFCFVLFVQSFAPLVQGFVLGVYRRGVRFERLQMYLELLEVLTVIRRAELRLMQLLELDHQFGMSFLQLLLRGSELSGD